MSHQTKENVLFISGIDTNVGKTVATGMIAKALAKAGKKVITQKMIQTGCEHVSEDIEAHRQIQGIPFTDEDMRGLTCPYIFTYPTAGQLREWLSTYFRIVHEEEGNIALTFRHPLEVLRHLKYTGVTANASRVWTRGKQERFCRDYQERFPSADGGVTLTYRPLYILVVKR